MIQQSTLTVESTEVIPTGSISFQNITPDHTHKSRKAQDGHERRVLDYTARLAEASEQLKQEIQERQYADERLLRDQQNLCQLFELRDRDRQRGSDELEEGLVRQLVAAIRQLQTFSRLARRA